MTLQSRRIALVATALLALAAPAARSGCQSVLVRAVDASSGRPLVDAIVALLDVGGAVRAQAATDTTGQRLLRAPAAGVFRVTVQLVGLPPFTSAPVTLPDTGIVSIELRGPAAGAPSANARTSRRAQLQTEFEERRRLGRGVALTSDDMRNMASMRTAFEFVPSVVVQAEGGSAFDFRVLMPADLGGRCAPTIWVDGMRGAQEMLASMNVADVLGIEVYRRFGSAPAKYQAGNSRCGVILIWTSHPS